MPSGCRTEPDRQAVTAPTSCWSGLRRLGLAGLVLLAGLAHADIWGYVDGQGVAHFADTRLDARYELFSRSGQSFQSEGAGEVLRPLSVPSAPPRLMAFFEVSPGYKQVRHLLREAALAYGLDYELLQAVIAAESGFDASAVSPKGAVGLMQIRPATAQRYGLVADARASVEKKLTDPRTNIRLGARHLSALKTQFGDDMALVLAAYNAGEGAVLRAGRRVPDFRETQSYVRTVQQLYTVLKPPPVVDLAQTSRRVRTVLAGGALGRGNALPETLPQLAAGTGPAVD